MLVRVRGTCPSQPARAALCMYVSLRVYIYMHVCTYMYAFTYCIYHTLRVSVYSVDVPAAHIHTYIHKYIKNPHVQTQRSTYIHRYIELPYRRRTPRMFHAATRRFHVLPCVYVCMYVCMHGRSTNLSLVMNISLMQDSTLCVCKHHVCMRNLPLRFSCHIYIYIYIYIYIHTHTQIYIHFV
jgi:hypothetical protein